MNAVEAVVPGETGFSELETRVAFGLHPARAYTQVPLDYIPTEINEYSELSRARVFPNPKIQTDSFGHDGLSISSPLEPVELGDHPDSSVCGQRAYLHYQCDNFSALLHCVRDV